MQTLQAYWPKVQYIVTLILAGGLAWTPFASFIADKVARPAPSSASWKRLLYDLLVDTPAFCAALGRVGIFGGKFNLPLIPSRLPVDNPPKEFKPTGNIIGPAAVLVLAGMLLSGCACWTPAHSQEPRCVVAHQTVDCTIASVREAVPLLLPVLQALISSGQFDATAAENFGKVVGFRDLGCSLAALTGDFLKGKAPDKFHAEARDTFTEWRRQYHHDVRFKLPDGTLR